MSGTSQTVRPAPVGAVGAPADPVAAAVPATPLLEVSGVTLQYKTTDHLVTTTYRFDFQVFKSDRYVLLGPSGYGKSTLLKAISGYLEPVDGTIRLNGHEVTRPGPDRMTTLLSCRSQPPAHLCAKVFGLRSPCSPRAASREIQRTKHGIPASPTGSIRTPI